MNPRGGGAAGYGEAHNRVGNVNPSQARPAQDNRVALDAEQLLFLVDPITDEAGPSYDLDILSEVQDHDHYQDAICAHHEEHVMHDSVQLNHVVDSHADYTSDRNMILYDQYVKDNEVPVIHNNVSSVSNDAFMMIYNDMCKPYAQSVSNPSQNTVVENSLTAELATYKEQVELFEEAIFKQNEEINERMTEMFSLLKELTKISLVRAKNDKGTESDTVIDENVVEHVNLVDNEESMDEEEGNEPNKNVNKDSTRYADRLLKIHWLCDKNDEESWALIEDLTLYDDEVSLVRAKNDKGTKSDTVIDENVVEHVNLLDNEESMDEEEGNEPNKNVNKDSTRHADRLLKIHWSLPT
uniref:Uncharacterized protein n=1 Tax=Tanacetum cinerariifolium TaxID=118510 RepID=A0A699IPG0_TANCI|nr:hypothetical protein [Tanacetum cinerariifolium]